MNNSLPPSEQFLCSFCTAELYLRYYQKVLPQNEQLKVEEHFIESPHCWEQLIHFSRKLSASPPNKTSHLEDNIKIADLMMAEYFLKKKRQQIKKPSATLPQNPELTFFFSLRSNVTK